MTPEQLDKWFLSIPFEKRSTYEAYLQGYDEGMTNLVAEHQRMAKRLLDAENLLYRIAQADVMPGHIAYISKAEIVKLAAAQLSS